MSEKDGGPAFPSLETDTCLPLFGMSLRDYFAGQALVGILANGDAESCPDAAKGSYAIADAMLAERFK